MFGENVKFLAACFTETVPILAVICLTPCKFLLNIFGEGLLRVFFQRKILVTVENRIPEIHGTSDRFLGKKKTFPERKKRFLYALYAKLRHFYVVIQIFYMHIACRNEFVLLKACVKTKKFFFHFSAWSPLFDSGVKSSNNT